MNVASILVPGVKMIFIDGSSIGTCNFITFLNKNYTALQNWVSAGGTLILNAAPSECLDNINLYFGGTSLSFEPALYGYIVNTNHPIFQQGTFQPSIAAKYIGYHFAHSYVSGSGLKNILTNEYSHAILSEKPWGNGRVIFGGLTLAFFDDPIWKPAPNVFNFYKNLLQYAVNFTTLASISTSTLSSNTICQGASVNIGYTANGTYNAGNTFTAQLSDASGSFSSPTNIGNVNATESGTINATIPTDALSGTGYRIRVVSGDPVVTGTDNGTDITINAIPSAGTLGGTQTICSGSTTTFSSTVSNGTWSSNDPAVATADASTGVVTGVSYGTATIIYSVTGSTCTGTATRTVIVNAVPVFTSPAVTNLPNVQYSDPINPVTVTVSDDGAGSSLSATTQWKTGSGDWNTGLPSDLSLNETNTDANSRSWALSGKANVAPGIYTIRITVSDGSCSSFKDLSLTVTQEDASIVYTGSEYYTLPGATATSFKVSLSATVKDITAMPAADPTYDADAGNITNAKVVFHLNNINGTVIGTSNVSLVDPSDIKTGVASTVYTR
ncbi:MAG: Ig-like domain-containing protein [Segetibacter sp.]